MMWKRILIVALILAGLSAALLLPGPELIQGSATDAELPPWSQSHRSESLDAERIAANYCYWAKRRILARIVTGQCTVDQAAKFFAVLDEANPSFDQKPFFEAYPGQSIEDCYRQQVMAWVSAWEKLKTAEELELKH